MICKTPDTFGCIRLFNGTPIGATVPLIAAYGTLLFASLPTYSTKALSIFNCGIFYKKSI